MLLMGFPAVDGIPALAEIPTVAEIPKIPAGVPALVGALSLPNPHFSWHPSCCKKS